MTRLSQTSGAMAKTAATEFVATEGVATETVARPLRWWDWAATAMFFVLVSVVVFRNLEWLGTGPARHLYVALSGGALLALAVLYVTIGRAALKRSAVQTLTTRSDYVFIGLLVMLMGAATAIEPWFAIGQALAYPMIWNVLQPYRAAVWVSGVLALTVGAGVAVSYADQGVFGAVLAALFNAVLSFAFALAMGTWISRIFDRGEEHRLIAEQLRTAQAEVTSLSMAAGATAERERLSRELHDTLTQTLAGLVMLSEQASRALQSGQGERAAERLERVQATAREAVSEARLLVATTQSLGQGGLGAAISRVSSRFQDDTGLRVHCDLAPQSLTQEDDVVLLRATQEGLANVRKHARASTAIVRLFNDATHTVLQVEDDGVGIDSTQPGGFGAAEFGFGGSGLRGFGLSGLFDRLNLAGGVMRVVPAPSGRGTLLEVRLSCVSQISEQLAEQPDEIKLRDSVNGETV